MYIALIKKDLLLLKDNFILLCGQILFILFIITTNLGIVGYVMAVVSTEWHFLMSVTSIEKASNTMGLLIATPYTKKGIITGRYLTGIVLFIITTVAYTLIALITKRIGFFELPSPDIIVITFFVSCLFISITLPLYLRFDDMTMRLISIGLILGTVFTWYAIVKTMATRGIHIDLYTTKQYINMIYIASAIVCLSLSRVVTGKLMEKFEY